MRIELFASGHNSITQLNDGLNTLRSSISSTIDDLRKVTRKMDNLTGGDGRLADAYSNIQARIRIEERRYDDVGRVSRLSDAFLENTVQTDYRVAGIVNQSQEQFFDTHPWLRPKNWLEQGAETLNEWWNKAVGWFVHGIKVINEICGTIAEWIKSVCAGIVDWVKEHALEIAIGVGAVLCIAAVTVLTCGVGTATLAGAVAVGAAKGALIGATVGIVAGTGVGYAVTGTWKGAATGAAIGFGAGAVIGAAIGGSISATQFGTFSSKGNMIEHYAKHGEEFGDMYSNAKEYAKGAKYVIKNGQYIAERNAYIRFFGSSGHANYAFVGMKAGGRISTYYVVSVQWLIKVGVALFQ